MKSTAMNWTTRAARHVLALAGAGLALPSASASAAVPAVRVMPPGDSITWGVGSATTSSYRRPLANLLANQSRQAVSFVGSHLNRGIDVPNAPNRLKTLVDRIFADKPGVTVLVDLDGDRRADYNYLLADPSTNAVTEYAWAGGDGHGGWINQGRVASGVPIP